VSPEQAIVGYELVHSAGNSAASRPESAAPDRRAGERRGQGPLAPVHFRCQSA